MFTQRKMFSIIAINIIMALTMFPQARANSWTQFHGDAAHIGYADFGPGASYFPTPRFVVGNNLIDFSSPCIMNAKIFVYGQITNVGGDTVAAKIVAFDEYTGDSLWATPIAKATWGSWSSPSADSISNSVYIASGDTLYRIDATTGNIIWRSKTKDIVVNASPTINIDDSLVYIHTYGGFSVVTVLHAFCITNGDSMWADSIDGEGQTSVAYDAEHGRVYTSLNTGGWTDPGKIAAFDAVTGDTIWISDSTYAHACFGGIVYDSTSGKVMAGGFNFGGTSSILIVNASDGSYVAEIKDVPSGDYTPAVGDSLIYICGIEGTSALNHITGDIVWNVPEAASWASSVVCAADDGTGRAVVYVGGDTSYTVSGRDTLYMLDANDGTILATYPTEGGGTPAIEHSNIYFVCNDSLVALGPPLTSVEELADKATVGKYYLYQNYPNPFSKKTVIRYTLVGTGSLPNSRGVLQYAPTLKIYDLSGRLVKNLSLGTGHLALGTAVSWDGTDTHNRPVPSGIYIYRLETKHFNESRKMLILK